MPTQSTLADLEHNIDDAIRSMAAARPESMLHALGLIRWLAAAQDGTNEMAQQSLNDIEDIASEAIHKR
jgi:hypothetical protein